MNSCRIEKNDTSKKFKKWTADSKNIIKVEGFKRSRLSFYRILFVSARLGFIYL